jgi:hypothetical protein
MAEKHGWYLRAGWHHVQAIPQWLTVSYFMAASGMRF